MKRELQVNMVCAPSSQTRVELEGKRVLDLLSGEPEAGAGCVGAVVEQGSTVPQSRSVTEQVCAIEMMLSVLLILSKHRLMTAVQPV